MSVLSLKIHCGMDQVLLKLAVTLFFVICFDQINFLIRIQFWKWLLEDWNLFTIFILSPYKLNTIATTWTPVKNVYQLNCDVIVHWLAAWFLEQRILAEIVYLLLILCNSGTQCAIVKCQSETIFTSVYWLATVWFAKAQHNLMNSIWV